MATYGLGVKFHFVTATIANGGGLIWEDIYTCPANTYATLRMFKFSISNLNGLEMRIIRAGVGAYHATEQQQHREYIFLKDTTPFEPFLTNYQASGSFPILMADSSLLYVWDQDSIFSASYKVNTRDGGAGAERRYLVNHLYPGDKIEARHVNAASNTLFMTEYR